MNLTERVRIRKAIATVAIGNPERRVHKALHRGSKQQLRLCVAISLIIACSRHAYIFLFFVHILFVVNHTINATPPERLQQHPLLFTTNHVLCVKAGLRMTSTSWSQHHFVAIGNPERHVRKASHRSSNNSTSRSW